MEIAKNFAFLHYLARRSCSFSFPAWSSGPDPRVDPRGAELHAKQCTEEAIPNLPKAAFLLATLSALFAGLRSATSALHLARPTHLFTLLSLGTFTASITVSATYLVSFCAFKALFLGVIAGAALGGLGLKLYPNLDWVYPILFSTTLIGGTLGLSTGFKKAIYDPLTAAYQTFLRS